MCKVKGALVIVIAALAGGVVSRALPSWPEARAQDFNDGNPFTVEYLVGAGMTSPVAHKVEHVLSTKTEGAFLVLKVADRSKVYLNPATVLVMSYKPEGS